MINKINSSVKAAIVHQLGKKSDEEGIFYSKEPLALDSKEIHNALLDYFLNAFKEPIFYNFTYHDEDFVLNPLYNYVGNIFDNPELLHEESIKITKLLYEKSTNPMIKAGDLCVALITDVLIDDEMVDALAIFKSEEKDAFLEVQTQGDNIDVEIRHGINIKKLDKACLILNTDRDIGFKILNIDHSNRQKEARFWRDDFLYIKTKSDDYHNTNHMIKVTSDFVKKRMPADAPIDAKKQSLMMKRSEAYFKQEEEFDLDNYKTEVFKDERTALAFEDYRKEVLDEKQTKKQFPISDFAVKKQSRVFKSVIKLDKNFHVYVHGDHSKITKGELENGQKYYMLYYDDER